MAGPMISMIRLRWAAWLSTGALACSIDLPAPPANEEDEPPESTETSADPQSLGVIPLRRLTRAQFTRTAFDLFGEALPVDLEFAAMLPVDDQDGGFAANSTAINETTLSQYERVAELIADHVAPRRGQLQACLADPLPSTPCAASFVDAFGPRALRRPLTTDEREELATMMWTSPPATADDADLGVRRVIATLLGSPDFLYRIERGEAEGEAPDTVRLTGHEIAARMSYLVWGSMPDPLLTADAAAGRLHDPGFRATVLQRMLEQPAAREGLAMMHRQWLSVDALGYFVKDRNLYPNFTEALGPDFDDELTEFVDRVVRRHDGTLHSLLTANVTVGSPAVEFWYGEDVVARRPWAELPHATSELTLDAEHRAGVLTLLSVMAAHAKPDRSDPVNRGVLVRERLLCQPLAAPPPNVAIPPDAPVPGASLREQLMQHTADPACAACHALIDPVGLAFEHYDAMGGFRTHDAAGNPIDAKGTVPDSDIVGSIDDAVGLAHALAGSEQVERCYATQWFRYAIGRIDDAQDDAMLTSLQLGFRDSGGHIPTLLRLIVGSDAFIHRRRE